MRFQFLRSVPAALLIPSLLLDPGWARQFALANGLAEAISTTQPSACYLREALASADVFQANPAGIDLTSGVRQGRRQGSQVSRTARLLEPRPIYAKRPPKSSGSRAAVEPVIDIDGAKPLGKAAAYVVAEMLGDPSTQSLLVRGRLVFAEGARKTDANDNAQMQQIINKLYLVVHQPGFTKNPWHLVLISGHDRVESFPTAGMNAHALASDDVSKAAVYCRILPPKGPNRPAPSVALVFTREFVLHTSIFRMAAIFEAKINEAEGRIDRPDEAEPEAWDSLPDAPQVQDILRQEHAGGSENDGRLRGLRDLLQRHHLAMELSPADLMEIYEGVARHDAQKSADLYPDAVRFYLRLFDIALTAPAAISLMVDLRRQCVPDQSQDGVEAFPGTDRPIIVIPKVQQDELIPLHERERVFVDGLEHEIVSVAHNFNDEGEIEIRLATRKGKRDPRIYTLTDLRAAGLSRSRIIATQQDVLSRAILAPEAANLLGHLRTAGHEVHIQRLSENRFLLSVAIREGSALIASWVCFPQPEGHYLSVVYAPGEGEEEWRTDLHDLVALTENLLQHRQLFDSRADHLEAKDEQDPFFLAPGAAAGAWVFLQDAARPPAPGVSQGSWHKAPASVTVGEAEISKVLELLQMNALLQRRFKANQDGVIGRILGPREGRKAERYLQALRNAGHHVSILELPGHPSRFIINVAILQGTAQLANWICFPQERNGYVSTYYAPGSGQEDWRSSLDELVALTEKYLTQEQGFDPDFDHFAPRNDLDPFFLAPDSVAAAWAFYMDPAAHGTPKEMRTALKLVAALTHTDPFYIVKALGLLQVLSPERAQALVPSLREPAAVPNRLEEGFKTVTGMTIAKFREKLPPNMDMTPALIGKKEGISITLQLFDREAAQTRTRRQIGFWVLVPAEGSKKYQIVKSKGVHFPEEFRAIKKALEKGRFVLAVEESPEEPDKAFSYWAAWRFNKGFYALPMDIGPKQVYALFETIVAKTKINYVHLTQALEELKFLDPRLANELYRYGRRVYEKKPRKQSRSSRRFSA